MFQDAVDSAIRARKVVVDGMNTPFTEWIERLESS